MGRLSELLPGIVLLLGTVACILNSISARKLAGHRGIVFETHQILLLLVGAACLIGSSYLLYQFFTSF